MDVDSKSEKEVHSALLKVVLAVPVERNLRSLNHNIH